MQVRIRSMRKFPPKVVEERERRMEPPTVVKVLHWKFMLATLHLSRRCRRACRPVEVRAAAKRREAGPAYQAARDPSEQPLPRRPVQLRIVEHPNG